MKYLYIDTSSAFLFSAILEDNKVIGEKRIELGHNLSTNALYEISTLFEDNNINVDDINKIIVVDGPGSFTGIRIGITIAKVYAWAKKIPITTTSALLSMALSSKKQCIHVPILDARNDYVYAAIYDEDYKELLNPQHMLKKDLLEELSKYDNYTFISNDNFNDIDNIEEYVPNFIKIVDFNKNNKDINPHAINPNYLKMTKAEESKLND